MKLMQFIEKAKKAYIKAYTAIDKETNRHNDAMQKYKQEISKYSLDGANEEQKRITEEHNAAMKKIDEELQAELEAAEKGFTNEVNSFYQPKGESMDENDIKLLASGFPLTSREISEMTIKHAENPTMIRMIEKYAVNNNIQVNTDIDTVFARARKSGEAELSIFNSFKQLAGNPIRMAYNGLAGTDTYIKCADKIEEYVADTEIKLKKAKIYLDEATKRELLDIQTKRIEENNKNYNPHGIDYFN